MIIKSFYLITYQNKKFYHIKNNYNKIIAKKILNIISNHLFILKIDWNLKKTYL